MTLNWNDRAKLQSLDQSTLNVLINGKSGSGKTWLACSIAEGIIARLREKEANKPMAERKGYKVIHFDKEDGAKARIKPNTPDWYMLKKEEANLANFLDLMPSILSDPTVGVILVDNVTTIWRDAQDGHQEHMVNKLKKGKQNAWNENKIENYKEGQFAMYDWKPIKKQYYALVQAIIDSDKHLVCISRAGDEYDMSDPKQAKKTGNLTVKAEGETKFEFDLFIEMALQENVTGPDQKGVSDVYWGKCTKDRWDTINGQVVKSPNHEWVMPVFDNLAKEHNIKQNDPTVNQNAFMDSREKEQKAGSEWMDKMLVNSDVKAAFDNYGKALGKDIDNKNRKMALMKYLGDEKAFFTNMEKLTKNATPKTKVTKPDVVNNSNNPVAN